jgi:hypothetical protein
MEYSAKTTLPLNSIGINSSLLVFRYLSIGIIFTHILFAKRERMSKGSYFTHKYLFLAIHAKGEESISPKQKDRTTTNLKILKKFSNGIVCLIYWYNHFQNLVTKTLLNTKRRNSFRGSFV